MAQRIASSLERFGSARFKSIGHKIMENVINSGALGVEIIVSGKIPSARAKSWRFYQGYLKKCGDIAISGVRKAQATALLKSGIVGIKVAIMPPDLVLPDKVELRETVLTEVTVDGQSSPSPMEKTEEVAVEPSAKKKVARKKGTGAPRKRKMKEADAVPSDRAENEMGRPANQTHEEQKEQNIPTDIQE